VKYARLRIDDSDASAPNKVLLKMYDHLRVRARDDEMGLKGERSISRLALEASLRDVVVS